MCAVFPLRLYWISVSDNYAVYVFFFYKNYTGSIEDGKQWLTMYISVCIYLIHKL